jgi:hypothetical protein
MERVIISTNWDCRWLKWLFRLAPQLGQAERPGLPRPPAYTARLLHASRVTGNFNWPEPGAVSAKPD